MRYLLPVCVCIVFLLGSCGSKKIQEGEIEYKITYPYADVSAFVIKMLPEKMTLTFKGSKIKSAMERSKIFKTELVSDKEDESVEMRMFFGSDRFYVDLGADDLQKLINSQPTYAISKTDQKDSINGFIGTAYEVKNPNPSIKHDLVWFTQEFAPKEAFWYSSYKGVKGLPLVFDIERYGIIMHLEMISFNGREVKPEEFSRPKDLEPLDYDGYEQKVQDLFDILLN